jgi:hypothetical protein
MKLLSIDPGMNMGLCLWEIDVRPGKSLNDRVLCRAMALASQSSIRVKGDYLGRMDRLVSWFSGFLDQNGVEIVVCEHPEVFNSGRGAAANASGDILKLTGLCYSLRQVALDRVTWAFAPVSVWKGQVKKQVTELRIRRAWGWRGTDNNEADAVGIGDWVVRKGGGIKLGLWDRVSEEMLFQTGF